MEVAQIYREVKIIFNYSVRLIQEFTRKFAKY